MNDTKIGLKNLISYLELEYWLHVLKTEGMEYLPPKSECLRNLLNSIVNNETMPKSLNLNDLLDYSKEVDIPLLNNYIREIIKVKAEITNENIENHKSYLDSQILYVHYFNKNVYSLNLKSSTMSIKLRSIKRTIFEKIFKDEILQINEMAEFEVVKKYRLFRKTIFNSKFILGSPKECANYLNYKR